MTLYLKFALNSIENIVGWGEKAGFQHFLFFHQCFQNPSFSGSLIVGIIWERVRHFTLTRLSHFFNSTGQRPASYCHGIVSVIRLFVCPCVCKLCLPKTSPQKLLTGFLPNITGMIHRWSSFKFLQIIVFHEEFWLP